MKLDDIPVPLRRFLVTDDPLAHALSSQLEAGFFLEDEPARELARLLRLLENRGWTSKGQAELLHTLIEATKRGSTEEERVLASDTFRYVEDSPPDDVFAVSECLLTIPPPQFTIVRLLSKGGQHKLVFLALTATRLGPIVLKRYRVPDRVPAHEVLKEITARSHPNIVRTDYFQNSSGEHFFTEDYMENVLGDNWRLKGYSEPVNVTFDILSALSYLHVTLRRIHGDIKPDNIACTNGRYLLLDFGNSTPISSHTKVPSGSLRTRAPELLSDVTEFQTPPDAADIWSLGATVFHLMTGRYPLLEENEHPPHSSDESLRIQFRQELQRRAESEYDKRVDVRTASIPPAFRPIVQQMLAYHPVDRSSTTELLKRVEQDLAPYIRHSERPHGLSPFDEVAIIERQLGAALQYRDTPHAWLSRCRTRLRELLHLPGWAPKVRHTIENLIQDIDRRIGGGPR